MAVYKFKAKTSEGKMIAGSMDVANEFELHDKLLAQDAYVMSYKVEDKRTRGRKIKAKPLCEFCRSLGTLLKAGVSLVRALSIICQEESLTPALRKIFETLLVSVRQGTTLSDAMEELQPSFPALLINMVRSAEAGGNLDKVMLRMAEHFEKDHRLKSKVSGALVYPCILLFLVVVIVIFIFTFVLPQFQSMFDQMESLPLPTRIVMGFSDIVTQKWYLVLIVIAVLALGISMLRRVYQVRYQIDRMKIRMPIFGKLLRVLYTARFARTISSLYSAGVPMILTLNIAKNTIGNRYIETQFETVIQKVRAGVNLSEALSEVDGLVRKMSSSIMIGEETGSLDTMLDSMADTMDYEAELAINKMVSFMEPVLIILMALIVGTIMIAVLMPIYGSYESLG